MEQKSNTLVIHPKDLTTDCLEVIYEGRGWDVIREYDALSARVRREIQKHDRIIMLGHGTPYGLLAGADTDYGFVRFHHYIVDYKLAKELKKKNTFSIWCHSDEFFRRHGIPGFHSKMVISEVDEEWAVLGKAPLDEEEMEKNMEVYCEGFRKYLDLDNPEEMVKNILEEYNIPDEVTQFNRQSFCIL